MVSLLQTGRMTRMRRAAAMLAATAAVLLAIPPTASAAPVPHGTLVRESFDRLPLGPVTEGRGWTTDTLDGSLTVEPSTTGHGRELRLPTEGKGDALLVLSHPPLGRFAARRPLHHRPRP